jgi:hypothetical protein
MVEVTIPEYRLKQRTNEVLKGQLMLQELREALVPVTGVLFPTGVSWGTLSITTAESGDTVLRWDE